MAVHKVFFPQGQEPEEKWIKRQQHRNQKPDFEWTRDPLSGYSGEEPSEVDHQQLMKKWEALAEMHNMTRLMQRFQLTRLQLIRLVGEDWAQRLNRDALRRGLEQAGREGYSIELTLENSGVRHIRRGLLPQVTSYGKWLNLLEGSFNLHIDESQINQVWRVKVPTRNGPVHVLEVFDKGDRPVLRFLADDALTMKEPAAWAEMIKTCEPLSIEE